MADNTNIQWIYPPGFDGLYGSEAVGNRRIILQCSSVSDGTGESDVVKINRSELQCITGATPSKLTVDEIKYRIQGMGLTIEWDSDPDERIAYFEADDVDSGCQTFMGGKTPTEDGGTGDIKFTTSGAGSGDSYDITITVRLKE